MKIQIHELGPIGVNCYLMLPENSDGAIVVDAPHDSAEAIPIALKSFGRRLDAILITHGHFDHIWNAAALAKKTGAKIYASAIRRDLIESAEAQSKNEFMKGYEPAKIDVAVTDGQKLDIDGVKIECFDVPGHCDGSVAYWLPKEKLVFSGDLLFRFSIGRTDLEGGDFDTLEKSVREKIYTLPDDTIIMTGHGERSSVGDEKKHNEYIRA